MPVSPMLNQWVHLSRTLTKTFQMGLARATDLWENESCKPDPSSFPITGRKIVNSRLINWKKGSEESYPYPHCVVEQVFPEDALDALLDDWPQNIHRMNTVMGGRHICGSRSQVFQNLLENSSAWKQVWQELNDVEFLRDVLKHYAEPLADWQCQLNHENIDLDDNAVVYMDLSAAGKGYKREIHRDSDLRVWNFLVFLNDPGAIGGEFVIHSSDRLRKFKQQHWKVHRKIKEHRRFAPRRNLGIFFLSTPNSYHSVTEIVEVREERKFIYGSLSFNVEKYGDVFLKRAV